MPAPAYSVDLPEVRKATWAFGHALRRMGRPPAAPDLSRFSEDYVTALRDFARIAADPRPGDIGLAHGKALQRTLVIGWHFPEHLHLLAAARHENVLVLVAEEQPWLEGLAEAGLILNFRSHRCPVMLARWMASGRPVYANIDHCYPETANVVVPFLSYPARTPVGIFSLAERYGYQPRVVAPREDGTRIVLVDPEVQEPDAEGLCRAATATVEAEILRAPARWTMWPAVDQRWVGVEYG